MSGYWRSETFESLEAAASAAADRWPRYSAFARLQEQGLRKQALEELDGFVAQISTKDLASRWEFVHWLCDSVLGSRVVSSSAAPYTLVRAVVLPTLQEKQAEGSCPEPFLWAAREFRAELGKMRVSPEATLRAGLELFPTDVSLRRALASLLLGQVEYSAHHLHESKYLGDPREDLEILAEARNTLSEVAPSDPLVAQIDRMTSLVSAWQAFAASGESNFPGWCSRNGVEPPAGYSVYYAK